MSFARGVLQEV